MKATLEYNLPEDRIEHQRAVHSGEAWSALYNIDSMLRNLLKYGNNDYKTAEELAHALRAEISDVLYKVEE